MAELIDRSKLMFLLERELDMNGITDWGKGYMEAIHDAMEHAKFMETTTEAEIRATAISDFLQFVYDNASNEEYANEDGWAISDLIDLEYKFLEQLKEE